MRKSIFSLFLIAAFAVSAQAQLNEYKYIIIPKKFNAFKKENQYLTSTLVKHLFVEKGYNAVYEDALPEELINNRCLGLTAELNDSSTMFMTKSSIVLTDCKGQEAFSTKQGSSKEKEFKLSYGEAIREAFQTFDGMNYSYTPATSTVSSEPVIVSLKNDVKQVQETSEVAIVQKEAEMQENIETSLVDKEPVVEQQISPEEQSYKNLEPKPSEIKKAAPAVTVSQENIEETVAESLDVLYAQAIPNGFQLVDSSPKVILKLLKTSLSNTYLAEKDSGNGLVYQKNGQWFLEYYEGSNLKVEKLNIKF